MPRNIVICCDGTSNEFGETNTNVLRLFQSLVRDDTRQICYYDPGVGTLPEPYLFTGIARKLSVWGGLMFGWGLTKNVEEAYRFLMNTWQPGDRVFLFGFSRGAYTIRVLASLLRQAGLLLPGQEQMLPYALRVFNAIREKSDSGGGSPRSAARPRDPQAAELTAPATAARPIRRSYWRFIGEFRNTFARKIPGRHTRFFPIHFLGAWDTVSSYGRVWNPRGFPYTRANPSVRAVRHALALDEKRWMFRHNLFKPTLLDPERPDGPRAPQDLAERWFAGVHSDVGGGYPDPDEKGNPRGLWRVSFEWMVGEAQAAGLLVDPATLEVVRKYVPASAEPWRDGAHESLHGFWWLLQFFPKKAFDEHTGKRRLRVGWPLQRNVTGGILHASVLRRIQTDPAYHARSLSSAAWQQIREMGPIQDSTTFTVPEAVLALQPGAGLPAGR